jgi:ABC-2 type transport system ATP-binding protein
MQEICTLPRVTTQGRVQISMGGSAVHASHRRRTSIMRPSRATAFTPQSLPATAHRGAGTVNNEPVTAAPEATTPPPVVDIESLWVTFGTVDAVRGIDLQVAPGAATALLGRNGAGKSTTMRVLAGVIPPTEGRVHVAGLDIRRQHLAVKRVTGYCPDVGGLVPRATPWEHLQLAARLRRLPVGWEERARDLLERFDLGGVAHRVTGGFSHGMGRRMSVILAAFHQPKVVLLDEPFDGVDPLGVEATMDVIADARAHGAAVLVSTHLRELAVEACQRAIVLRGGSAVAELSAVEIGGEDGAGVYRALLD